MQVRNGDTLTADYYGELVTGKVTKFRFHDGYAEWVFYLELDTPRLNFSGNLTNTVLVRYSQVIKDAK